MVCFRHVADGRARFLDEARVAALGTTVDALWAAAVAGARGGWAKSERVAVGGTAFSYRRLVDPGGLASVVLLDPAAVAAELGPEVRIAVPTEHVALAWAGGDAERDLLMGVGVREWFDAGPVPVSPVVFTLREGELVPVFEARPSGR